MSPRDRNQETYAKGDSLYRSGRFSEASKLFLSALEEDGTDYQALWALGNCYAELKKPRKAEASFRQALACCDETHRAALTFNLANALFDQQRYAEALEIYREIPASDPLSRKARRNADLARRRMTGSGSDPLPG